jgi:hypothetical protein
MKVTLCFLRVQYLVLRLIADLRNILGMYQQWTNEENTKQSCFEWCFSLTICLPVLCDIKGLQLNHKILCCSVTNYCNQI